MQSYFEKVRQEIKDLELKIKGSIYDAENKAGLSPEERDQLRNETHKNLLRIDQIKLRQEEIEDNFSSNLKNIEETRLNKIIFLDIMYKKCERKFKALSWIFYISVFYFFIDHYVEKSGFNGYLFTHFTSAHKVEQIHKIRYVVALFICLLFSMYYTKLFFDISCIYFDIKFMDFIIKCITFYKFLPYKFMIILLMRSLLLITKVRIVILCCYGIFIYSLFSVFEK